MRLFLFSLFLLSVPALSAPLDEVQETGVFRPERQEGEDVPADCCEPRYSSCSLPTYVHCQPGEWVLRQSSMNCFWGFIWYDCCGRCECKTGSYGCAVKNKPNQDLFNDPRE